MLILKIDMGKKLVRLAGLEPATHGLGIHCSVQTELQAYASDSNL